MSDRPEPARLDRGAVHAAVDRVVLAHGAYVPLELLLELGRLAYPDYEAWRTGGVEALDGVLIGNAARVRAQLEEAARWAAALGLAPEADAPEGWGPLAGERVALSRDGALARLLGVRYTRAEPPAQGDLFLDSSESAALAVLRGRLAARDAAGAAECLEALLRRQPDHRLRAPAERLCDALADLAAGDGAVVATPEEELEALRGPFAADARALLGARARDFLAPFWRRLAARLADHPFEPERPERHRSYALAQCLAWREAAACVRATPGHDTEPVLLARLAEAERRGGERARAIDSLARLCWCAPAHAGEWLDAGGFPDAGVRAAWAELRDLDLEPAPETTRLAAWLPSWLLVTEPGLARAGDLSPPAATGPAGEAFEALRALHAIAPGGAPAEEAIRERARLRDAHPGLLALYLARRAARRPRRPAPRDGPGCAGAGCR